MTNSETIQHDDGRAELREEVVRELESSPLYNEDLAPVPVARRVPVVMVVDDSITMRKVTGRVLERHNMEVLTAKDGFAPIDKTEVALVAAPDSSPATLRLAERLAEFCHTVQAKAA